MVNEVFSALLYKHNLCGTTARLDFTTWRVVSLHRVGAGCVRWMQLVNVKRNKKGKPIKLTHNRDFCIQSIIKTNQKFKTDKSPPGN